MLDIDFDFSPKLIKIGNYGNYSSSNYGSCRFVQVGGLTLYYSYDTVVAFEDKHGMCVSDNVWSKTTGKHLNWLREDKSSRIKHEEFEDMLRKALICHGLMI